MSDHVSIPWNNGGQAPGEVAPVVLATRLFHLGRTLWLELHGVLNCRTTDVFRQHVRAGLAHPCRRVVVDLTGLEYVGGNGLHALAKLQEELTARGIEFRLVVPEGSRCARTFTLAKLHGILPTFARSSQAWRHRDRTPKPAGAGRDCDASLLTAAGSMRQAPAALVLPRSRAVAAGRS